MKEEIATKILEQVRGAVKLLPTETLLECVKRLQIERDEALALAQSKATNDQTNQSAQPRRAPVKARTPTDQ